jgi:PAS domain S-box-containing protein
MPYDPDVELDKVQRKIVDSLHAIVLFCGFFAVSLSVARGLLVIGSIRHLVPAISVILVVAATYAVRGRIHWVVRSWVLMVGLMVAGGAALWSLGVSAPAGIMVFFPSVLAWLIWPRRQAVFLSGLALTAFLAVAWKNISHGDAFDSRMPTFNRSPLFWTNLGVVYLITSSMLLTIILNLLGAWRRALDRARTRERESITDRERLSGILAGIHDTVFIHDLDDGGILEIHGRYEEMYGGSVDLLRGMTVEQLSAGVPPWTQIEARGWMTRTFREGPQTFPWKARHLGGTEFWVEVSMRIFPVGGIDRLVVTVSDIDQSMKDRERLRSFNKALETRVEERTAQIRKEREAMEEFSYMVSHDLRAPLRGIDGFARALEEDHGTELLESGREMTSRIRRGAARMSRLIDAFLSLSRVDRVSVKREEVELRPLVEEIVDEIRQAGAGIPGKAVAWRIGSLPSVHSDPDLVRQVLANLLSNAAKFSGLGGSPEVRIESVRRGDLEWIEIVDNGPGFEMSQTDRLFKAFSRLHGDSVEGIGIGLATVKRIVERLGGAVEAEGRPGGGATFRFRLGAAVPGDRTETEIPVRS